MSGDSANLADGVVWQAVLGTRFGAVWQWEILFSLLAVAGLWLMIAAAFWAGGLLPLLLLMREARQIDRRTDAIRTMMRFSRYSQVIWLSC